MKESHRIRRQLQFRATSLTLAHPGQGTTGREVLLPGPAGIFSRALSMRRKERSRTEPAKAVERRSNQVSAHVAKDQKCAPRMLGPWVAFCYH